MKISVIIPVYNAEQYLYKCLDSVVAQTYDAWEVIAIDDGSKDNSFRILEEYARKDQRFHVETKKNEGSGLTRNRALEQATGDMIVFLDADDYIEKDYFRLLEEEVKRKGRDVVFIDVTQERPDGSIIKYEKMSSFKNRCRKELLGCQMTGYMPWGGWRKAVSREIIDQQYLRYTADTVGEEAIFSFELLRNAVNIGFIEKNLYHYINHPGSQSKNPNGTWTTTLQKMKAHLKEKGIWAEYEEHISSFGFIVMISWLLQYAKQHSIMNTLQAFKKERRNYQTEYGWHLNPHYLRKEVRLLFPFVRMNWLLPVVVAAKMCNR